MRTLLLIATCLLSGFAFAQEDDSADSDSMESSSDSTPKGRMSDGSSRGARVGKMASVELGYGLFVGSIPGAQFAGYYAVSSDLHAGLMYGSGTLDLTSVVGTSGTAKTEEAVLGASFVGAAAKYYLGNSFYVAGGLGQRVVDAKVDITSTVIDYGIEGSIEATTMALLIGIGNQWQWDGGFTLGVEWLGYMSALSSDSSSSLTSKGTASGSSSEAAAVESLKGDFEDLAEAIGEAGTTRLFMISAGWAF